MDRAFRSKLKPSNQQNEETRSHKTRTDDAPFDLATPSPAKKQRVHHEAHPTAEDTYNPSSSAYGPTATGSTEAQTPRPSDATAPVDTPDKSTPTATRRQSSISGFVNPRTKKQRTQPAPKDVLFPPPKPPTWFQENYQGSRTEQSINRWVGSLKLEKNKYNQLKSFIADTLEWWKKQGTTITEEAASHPLAVKWGVPTKTLNKLANQHTCLPTLLAIACFFQE